MSRAFRTLIERQIAKTRAQGGLSGLEGEGKPLPHQDPSIDAGEAAAMRIMAQAGVVPEEFTLKQKLDAAQAHFMTLVSEADKRAQSAVIADLELRYNIARESRRAFMK
ncbi:DnaJ family domain-containing protein [Tateyamaria armeniaca]|uniref:DnaJ family domain-containing protein n=1 Tax=Tateyamaria armeniaca TaxID=2518930 RepID=A0ABW8UUZ5_9RHOB